MSLFDPQTFLDATLTEPTEKRPPLPIGEYTAIITSVEPRVWESKKPDAKIKSGVAIDANLQVEVPLDLQESIKLPPHVKLNDSIMLSLTAGGGIDNAPGANNSLRRYREATDLNKPGDSFTFRHLQGKVVKVKISHEIYNGEPVERVASVARL